MYRAVVGADDECIGCPARMSSYDRHASAQWPNRGQCRSATNITNADSIQAAADREQRVIAPYQTRAGALCGWVRPRVNLLEAGAVFALAPQDAPRLGWRSRG